jgi:hypothetical protein
MVYYDYGQGRHVSSTPTIISDIRAHVANWRQFKKATTEWTILSISTFLMRFVIVVAGIVTALWYGVARHGWGRDQYFLISLGALIPIMFLWFLVERAAWNHDLRTGG